MIRQRLLTNSIALAFGIAPILGLATNKTAHPIVAKNHNKPEASQTMIGKGDCIGLVDSNLAKGPDNFFLYVKFSSLHIRIKQGDVLSYDVFLSPNDPMPKGGIDITFSNGDSLRDSHIPDQNGIDSHGDGLLTPAVDHWYSRQIPLSSFAGHRTGYWTLVFEGDAFGQYAQFVDRVRIKHADGTSTWVFPSANLIEDQVDSVNGYSQAPALALIPRSQVQDGKPVQADVQQVLQGADRLRTITHIQDGLNLALHVPTDSATDKDALSKALADAKTLAEDTTQPTQQFNAAVQKVLAESTPAEHILRGLTADLIGHAHIDVQWLWQAPESLQAAHNTWNQATIFMKEFPGFTFTQSSAGYYREVQKTWPALFKRIQKYVKDGQWEIVGGRECEADENLISPEASASQFLYAQRYFQKEFGKTAVVGWEPDTFGHTAQMPQMLQLGGCKYYYFCRGGKGDPLFYWKAPDGTKVLAYDEVAAGAWYDTPLNDSNFHELPGYIKKSGRKEMMWVYGVGNHGGGPTKEYVEQALKWKKSPLTPTVRFSTAQSYFQHMAKTDTSTIPTIQSELEGVFMGCYTTNSFEKKRNDYAEADTVQAEAISAVAHAVGGWPYPTKRFAHNWEKILFNQHHDTLCGSSFHWAYQQTIPDIDSVIADDKDISRDALENLCVQVSPAKGGANFMVFNSLGWARSGWVNVYLPTSFGGPNPVFNNPVAVAPDGTKFPLTVINPNTRQAVFYAANVPAYGYEVYVIRDSKTPVQNTEDVVSDDGKTISNGIISAKFDLAKGAIQSLEMGGKEFAGSAELGRLIDTPEKPGADAWTIKLDGSRFPVNAISHHIVKSYKGTGMEFEYKLAPSQPGMKPTRVWQTFWLRPGSKEVNVDFAADWQVVSNLSKPSPFLRATFDSRYANPTARYQVPFAVVKRPNNGEEGPVQTWADVSNGDQAGFAVVVDCKHGFSCQGSDLVMSMIRGCYAPDPLPNPGYQTAKYSIVPHLANWKSANLSQKGEAIQTDLLSIPVPPDAEGTAPLTYSFANFTGSNIIPTGLKVSEDGNGYVFRFFNESNSSQNGILHFTSGVSGAQWVNFIENHLHDAAFTSQSVSIPLHKWQIGNVEVH